MITTLLIYAIAVVAFIQPNAPRLFAAVIFIGVMLLHELFLSSYTGLLYYGSAALFDLAIIIIISGINPVPKMVLRLHNICIVSILVNLAGWILWFFYYPPLAYDVAFVVIYIWVLITLIKRDGLHGMVGGFTLDSWSTCVRFNRSAWFIHLNKDTG